MSLSTGSRVSDTAEQEHRAEAWCMCMRGILAVVRCARRDVVRCPCPACSCRSVAHRSESTFDEVGGRAAEDADAAAAGARRGRDEHRCSDGHGVRSAVGGDVAIRCAAALPEPRRPLCRAWCGGGDSSARLRRFAASSSAGAVSRRKAPALLAHRSWRGGGETRAVRGTESGGGGQRGRQAATTSGDGRTAESTHTDASGRTERHSSRTTLGGPDTQRLHSSFA